MSSTSWQHAGEYSDIRYELATGEATGIAKITIDRPEVRNAFRPETVIELLAGVRARPRGSGVGVIILTGEGPDAFCSGGDQRVRGSRGGYVTGADPAAAGTGPSGASTSPTCTSRCGGCPSRSWRWWPATRSAAATSCTWSAT